MLHFNDQSVLITGARGGIGSETTKLFLDCGARVILTGTHQKTLQDFVDTLDQKTYDHSKIHTLVCDLNNAQETDHLFKNAEEQFGDISIVVNNAGITKDMLLMRMKDEDWNHVINVNLNSVFRICRSAISKMITRRYGRIINVSSVVATMGNAGQTNYCAAKAGMIGFSKALAREVASRQITVNCVAPGFIETNMTKDLNDKVKASLITQIPAGRMGYSKEIASGIVYLASPLASYITGQTLHINGGMEMV